MHLCKVTLPKLLGMIAQNIKPIDLEKYRTFNAFSRKLFFEEKKNWLCHKKLFKKFYNSICIYFAIDNVSFLKITEQNTYIYSQGKFPNIKTEIRKLLQLKDESIPSFFTVSTKMITDGISRFLYTKTWYVFFIITIYKHFYAYLSNDGVGEAAELTRVWTPLCWCGCCNVAAISDCQAITRWDYLEWETVQI